MTRAADNPARRLALVLVRVGVGAAFATLGAGEWARWQQQLDGSATALWHWISGCLLLTFGVWLAFGVLMPFAGVILFTHAVVAVVFTLDSVPWPHSAGLTALGVGALLVRDSGARWSADRWRRPRW